MRWILLTLLLASTASAQHLRSVGGFTTTVPYGWHAAPDEQAAIVASPGGEVRLLLWAEPPVALAGDASPRALADARVEALGGRIVDVDTLTQVSVDGEAWPAVRVAYVGRGTMRDLVAAVVGGSDGPFGVAVETLWPRSAIVEMRALETWISNGAGPSAGGPQPTLATSPVSLQGAYAHVASRSRFDWGADPPLEHGTDAEVWVQTRVDAYVFDADSSRVTWGLPASPLGEASPAPEHRRGRYAVGDHRLELSFDSGGFALLPATVPSPNARSIWLDGRRYDRLRPVETLAELDGTWQHDAVAASDARGRERDEEDRQETLIERIRTTVLQIDVSEASLVVAESSVGREIRETGSSSQSSPGSETEVLAELAAPGVLVVTRPNGEVGRLGAYWAGGWLLIDGRALRRAPPLAPGE